MSKINLLYDATCLAPHLLNGTGTGIYTVSFEILKELCHRKDFNIKLYCPDELYTQKKLISRLKIGLKKAPSEIRSLKIWNNKDLSKTDAFFSPMYTFPEMIKNHPQIDKYLFLHDAIPLMHPEYWKNQPMDWYFDVFQSLNKNDFYFTNSESTKRDFMRFNSNISDENTRVTLLACDESFKPQKSNIEKVLKKYNLPTDKKYVFSLCTLEPRKNLIRAVKTFIEFIKKNNIDDMVFILGGGKWDLFMQQMETELKDIKEYQDKILQAGYIDKVDLAPLYSGAEWFVYTSQYEGFGLPPLEAMACGTPVITSNNSSLPEVVGDAGIMIDWDSDDQHITAYEKYYFDTEFRQEMAQKGYERAKTFSWKKTVDIVEKQIKDRYANKKQLTDQKHEGINLLFDANVLRNAANKTAGRSGVFFVAYNLLLKLKQREGINLFLYVDNKNLQSIIDVLKSDEQLKDLKIASLANLKDMDAFLSPHSEIPDCIIQAGHIRTYKITYDLMGCIFDDKIFSTKIETHQRASLACQKQFCISESTKQDYLKFVPEVSPDNLIVTHLGASDYFHKCKITEIAKVKKKLHLPNRYILSVCNLAPHKNLFAAIDAFVDFIKTKKIQDLSYVLCGSVPKWNEAAVEEKMQSLGKYREHIILTGYVDDEDLPALYSGAEWFVFPSLYEGFGLPILEAMQCGTPVVCSNTSSMPEVIGDCGLLVDPNKKEEFSHAFETFYRSANFRTKCSVNGLQRARLFSWENMASIIAQTIEDDASERKDVYPIVLITDENYMKPTVVTITSILANKFRNSNYKIYVLGNSLSEKSKKLLSDMPSVTVIPFEKQFTNFEGTHRHVSAAALLKFKIAELFPQYDKVLYLDTDMIIQHDLSELFRIDLTDKYAVVVKDMLGMLGLHTAKRMELKDYFNSGMMLLNVDKMRKEKIGEKLLEYKSHQDTGAFMDQDCLNAVFNENVIYLSCKYNYMPVNQKNFMSEEVADFYGVPKKLLSEFELYAFIIHLTNKQKPWNYQNVYGSKLWAKYYYMSPLRTRTLKYLDKKKKEKFSLKNLKSRFFEKNKSVAEDSYKVMGIRFRRYKDFLNKTISFKELQNSDFKMTGISHAESWGRWSCADSSQMTLPLQNIKSDIHFSFVVKPFLPAKLTAQNVVVWANDVKVAEWHFEKGKPLPVTEFTVPEKLKTPKGKIFLRFEYQNAVSPHFLGMNEDIRKLALGFVSMEISGAKIKETHLLYSVTKKPDSKVVKLFGFLPLYHQKTIDEKNYKIKFYLLGFPIYSKVRKNYRQTIRILGIPFSWSLKHEELRDSLLHEINVMKDSLKQQNSNQAALISGIKDQAAQISGIKAQTALISGIKDQAALISGIKNKLGGVENTFSSKLEQYHNENQVTDLFLKNMVNTLYNSACSKIETSAEENRSALKELSAKINKEIINLEEVLNNFIRLDKEKNELTAKNLLNETKSLEKQYQKLQKTLEKNKQQLSERLSSVKKEFMTQIQQDEKAKDLINKDLSDLSQRLKQSEQDILRQINKEKTACANQLASAQKKYEQQKVTMDRYIIDHKKELTTLRQEFSDKMEQNANSIDNISEKAKIFDNLLKTGKKLDFSKNSASECVTYNFYPKETWGDWMQPEASLIIRFLNPQKDVKLSFQLKEFKTGASKKTLTIMANGQKIITTSKTSFTVNVSKLLIARDGLLELDFITQGAQSPKSQGISDDYRLLGYGLISIESDADMIVAGFDIQLMEYLFTKKLTSTFKKDEWDSFFQNEDISSKLKVLEKNLDKESIERIRQFINRKKNPYLFSAFEASQKELVEKNDLSNLKIDNFRGFQPEVLYFKNGLKFLDDNIIKEHLTGRDIIDGGACLGDSALMFSEYNFANNIYSFEPLAEVFEHLRQTLKNNNCKKAQPINAGLSDVDGKMEILGENCPVMKIDTFAADKKIGCIKLDVEGMEMQVLKGAVETIKRDKPLLLICLYHTPTDFFEIKPMLEKLNLGYKFIVQDTEPMNVAAGIHLMLIAY